MPPLLPRLLTGTTTGAMGQPSGRELLVCTGRIDTEHLGGETGDGDVATQGRDAEELVLKVAGVDTMRRICNDCCGGGRPCCGGSGLPTIGEWLTAAKLQLLLEDWSRGGMGPAIPAGAAADCASPQWDGDVAPGNGAVHTPRGIEGLNGALAPGERLRARRVLLMGGGAAADMARGSVE